jgi:3-hydroxyisobutyrate dehydrogenase-like beta-hydroxyacid dehydrogenase
MAFCESVALAEKSGIPREVAVEALMRSVDRVAAREVSRPVRRRQDGRARRLPPAEMIQKDLQLALDQARAVGVPLPTTALTQEWLTKARALGDDDRDFAKVFDVLAAMCGAPPAPLAQDGVH